MEDDALETLEELLERYLPFPPRHLEPDAQAAKTRSPQTPAAISRHSMRSWGLWTKHHPENHQEGEIPPRSKVPIRAMQLHNRNNHRRPMCLEAGDPERQDARQVDHHSLPLASNTGASAHGQSGIMLKRDRLTNHSGGASTTMMRANSLYLRMRSASREGSARRQPHMQMANARSPRSPRRAPRRHRRGRGRAKSAAGTTLRTPSGTRPGRDPKTPRHLPN